MDQIIIAIVAGAFGLAGIFIGARINAAASNRAAAAAEKRHFRELGMQVAMTNLEYYTKMAESAASRHGEMVEIPPFKVFLVQSINLVEIISDTSLSTRALCRKIAEHEDLAEAIYRDAKDRRS